MENLIQDSIPSSPPTMMKMATFYSAAVAASSLMKKLVRGDVDLMTKLYLQPPEEMIQRDCLRHEMEIPDLKLATIVLLLSIVGGYWCYSTLHPMWTKFLRWLCNDYKDMFTHTDWRFRCCPVNMNHIDAMNNGFGHPRGFEKFSWDLVFHSLSGIAFCLAYQLDIPAFSLIGLLINSTTSDFKDIFNWILGPNEENGFWNCAQLSRSFDKKAILCNIAGWTLLVHHISSIGGMMINITSKFYKHSGVQWSYMLIFFPATAPPVAVMLYNQVYKKSNRYANAFWTNSALTFAYFCRIEGLNHFGQIRMMSCCLHKIYRFMRFPLNGLAAFAHIGTLSAFLLPPGLSNRSLIPYEVEEFPLAKRRRRGLEQKDNKAVRSRVNNCCSASSSFSSSPTAESDSV